MIAAGYDRIPPGRSDDWGDLDAALDWGSAAVLSDLERQEQDAGFEPCERPEHPPWGRLVVEPPNAS